MTWEKYKEKLKPIWIIDDMGRTIHGAPETTPMTKEQEMAYRLADNKLNESPWDNGLVLEDLKALALANYNVELTGFSVDLVLEKKDGEDDVPEAPKEPRAKLGDLFKLGEHRLLCGDSTNAEDVSRLMAGTEADILITDPPYNVDYTGKTKDALKIGNDNKTDEEFCSFLSSAFFNANNAMRKGAVYYIWHADSEGFNFRKACRDAGWTVRQCLIWHKNVMVMGRQDYHWQHEPCLYGWKDGAAHIWNTDRKQTTILNFDRPTASKEHPTMKPVAMIMYQLCNNTEAGNVALDLFMGGGSTLIACEKAGRRCYGMELDPKYIDVIVERWEKFTGLKAEKV